MGNKVIKQALKERFHTQLPDAFFLEGTHSQTLESHLKFLGWLAPDEQVIFLEKPGEGNMNAVFRVGTDDRTFIVKQARPWVEKYPQVDAPLERASVEARFFSVVQSYPKLTPFTPSLLGFDPTSFMLAVEDLGPSADFTYLYRKGHQIQHEALIALTEFLNALHEVDVRAISPAFPQNRAMRRLNHEHIFIYPYLVENGFDLDSVQPGLQAISRPYKIDSQLQEKIATLGKLYLAEGDTLLHGDFYPGSWLKVNQGIRVIDPEFGFVGPAEFDLAVFIAHMMLAEQDQGVLRQIWERYAHAHRIDSTRVAGFAGIEVLRRLMGLAQLPVALSLAEKEHLLATGKEWIMSGKISIL